MNRRDKIKLILNVIRFFIPNVYFNFHYLPFYQACRMPILFYKPHFGMLKGSVQITGKVKFGMIRMGFNRVALYPDDGIRFQNAGGCIIFKGNCIIGSSSAIAIGKRGKWVVGQNFSSTAGFKIACQHNITVGNDVLCGWEVMMIDNDFHKIVYTDGRPSPNGFKPIVIGDGCWLALRSIIMKGTTIKDYCIISANSLCNKDYSESYALLAGSPAEIKKVGVYRDPQNDKIDYPDMVNG